MPTRITDLNIKKVSFVRRAANKRKFVLLKSDDSDSGTKTPNNNDRPKTKEVIVDEKLKKALARICKQERDPDKVIDLLKSEHEVTDEIEKEVRAALDLASSLQNDNNSDPAPSNTDDGDTKSDTKKGKGDGDGDSNDDVRVVLTSQAEELKKLQKENEELQKANQLQEEKQWLEKNAPFATGKADDLAARLVRLRKDEDAYEAYRSSLQAESVAKEDADLFKEAGTSSARIVSEGGFGHEYFSAIEKSRHEVKKSKGKLSPEDDLDLIRDTVAKMGPRAYDKYCREHARRAARLGGGNTGE